MRDIHNSISMVKSVTPIVCNNDTEGTGTGVDLQGYEAVEMIFHVGASGDTLSGSVYITPTLQESDDNVSFTNVAAADQLGTLTVIDDAAEDEVVQAVGYIGNKRYIRAFFDTTGTHTNGTPLSAVAVRHRIRHKGGEAV